MTFKTDRFISSSPYKDVQFGGKYLLSTVNDHYGNEVTFKESSTTNNDSELQYDAHLELTCSSASDITYAFVTVLWGKVQRIYLSQVTSH